MIVTSTPFRISFFGGGTDYRDWFERYGGAVISTTIDKYCYISCRYLPPFFEHKYRIVYSKIELVREVADIQHPSVRTILSEFCNQAGLEIHHDGDLPARSGLGSSSAFTVGLLNALHALRGNMSVKRELANQAIRVERDLMLESGGHQDQVAVAFGGLNRIDFHRDGFFEVNPIPISQRRRELLEQHLMLFFTGVVRDSAKVAAAQIANVHYSTGNLMRIHKQVDQAIQVLTDTDCDIREFGHMLHEGWHLKKSLSDRVSTSHIDSIYKRAMVAGALGGKILGAGGGGFMLFFVPPARREAVADALKELTHVPFRFERAGSHVVFNNPGRS